LTQDEPIAEDPDFEEDYDFEQDLRTRNMQIDPDRADKHDRLVLFANNWIHFLMMEHFDDYSRENILGWLDTRLIRIINKWNEVNVEDFHVHADNFIRTSEITRENPYILFNLASESAGTGSVFKNKLSIEMAGFQVPTTDIDGPAGTTQIRRGMKAIFESKEYLIFHETYKEWAMNFGEAREPTPEEFQEPGPSRERPMTPEADPPLFAQERARPVTPVLSRHGSPQFNAFIAHPTETVSTHPDPDQAQTVPHLSQGTALPATGPDDHPIPSMPASNIQQTDSSIGRRETKPTEQYINSAKRVQNTTIFEENITWSFVLAMVLLFLILWAIISKQS